MAKSASTYQGYQVPALQSDFISFADDFADFKTAIDNALAGVASAVSGSGNAVGGTSFADNAGKILSSSPTSPSRVGRVISLTANGDATFLFQDNPGGNTTGTDKWVIGYDDSSGGFAISESETIPSTITDADFSIQSGGAVTIAATLSVTGVASFPGGTGAIDAGASNITTGGRVIIDVDGSAIAAVGAITLGLAADAGIYFDATDLVIDTNGGSNGGIKLDSGDDTVEILGSGVTQATFSTTGLNLVSGDQFFINSVSVLSSTGLGATVVSSSLTSVGTLTGLAMAGNVTFTAGTQTVAGIQNQNLLDKTATETVSGTWTFTGTSIDIEGYGAIGDAVAVSDTRTLYVARNFSTSAASRQFQVDGVMTVTGGTSNHYLTHLDGSFTVTTASTHNILATAYINEPSITNSGGATIDRAATLYVFDLPTEGTGNAGVWVSAGDSGQVTPSTAANELVIEDNNNAGLSILSPAANNTTVYFGDDTDASVAYIQWNGTSKDLNIGSLYAGGELILRSGNGVVAGTFDSTGNLTLTDDLRVDGGDFGITADTDLMGLAADTVTVRGQADVEGYMAIGNGSALLDRFTLRVDRDFNTTSSASQILARGIITATAGTGFISNMESNPDGIVINSGNTHALVSSLFVDEPSITVTSGAVTEAASLYVQRAPTEGLSGNYALYVDDGLSRFDGHSGGIVFELPPDATDPTGGGVYGRIPVTITGVGTKYMVVYN